MKDIKSLSMTSHFAKRYFTHTQRSNDRLRSEEMSRLLNGRPDGRQRDEPEEEEAEESLGSGPAALGKRVVNVRIRREDGLKHDRDTFATEPGLYSPPDTGHDGL